MLTEIFNTLALIIFLLLAATAVLLVLLLLRLLTKNDLQPPHAWSATTSTPGTVVELKAQAAEITKQGKKDKIKSRTDKKTSEVPKAPAIQCLYCDAVIAAEPVETVVDKEGRAHLIYLCKCGQKSALPLED